MRRLLSRVLLLCGALGLVLGAVLSTVLEGLFDPVTFAGRSAQALVDPRVAAFAADRITDAALRQSPDLTAVRPLLRASAEAIVQSEAFRAVLRRAVETAHRTVFAEGTQNVVLSVPDVGVLLRSTLTNASPELAERIPARLETEVARLESSGALRVLLETWDLREALRRLSRTVLLVAAVLLVLGIWLAEDLRRGFVGVGLALMGAGAATWACLPLGHLGVTAVADPVGRAAAHGLWDVFVSPLSGWGLFLAGLGAVFAAAGTSLIESFNPLAWLRTAARRVAVAPASRRARAGRGLVLLAAGILAVCSPLGAIRAVLVAGGLLAGFLGARELFRTILETVDASPVALRAGAARRALLRGIVVAAVVGVLAGAWALLRRPTPRPFSGPVSCNGQAALCGRRVDQVVFPATHNAMSNTDVPDWMFPHHQAGIPTQLRDGVRGLLIDVHYGFPGGSRVKTDLRGDRPTEEAMREILGDEGVAAALRIRERLVGVDEGRRDLYLCHGFCELGASELVPTLRATHDFLVERPGEVLLVVVEDYVSPHDLARVFEESGLADLVYRGPSGPPWPTLGELARAGHNVLVFLESGRRGVAWLRPAFKLIQETPYTFHSRDEFSCRANRGPADASLFLVNHWIETTPAPRPSNAAVVNARDVLLARARQCQRERGRLPNLLAVDFYRSGDLLRVAAELNGVADG